MDDNDKTRDSDALLASLLEFPWDEPNRHANQCREMAQTIAKAIRVPLHVSSHLNDSTNETKNKSSSNRDDFASYAALVESAKLG